MTTWVRRLLQIAIVLCHVYLLAHSQEPLRMNVGDPWSDANVLTAIGYVREYGFLETSFTDILDVGPLTEQSYRYTHYPPLAEITYGAISKYVGVTRIETFRLFAIAFSALAMWLLYQYARRMYGESVALIATALWSGSLLWMLYADSIHQAPILQFGTFLGLWGLERAIATRRRRHYAAAIAGAFIGFLTSYDGWLFFPAAVLVTVALKAGSPLARGNRHFVAVCAAGCVLAIVAKAGFVIGALGWSGFVADVHLQFLERTTSTYERALQSGTPAIVRRLTMAFSPLVWLAILYHAVRAIRAPSLRAALEDTAAWLLACALAFLYLFWQLAASQWLPSQVMLPFYAIGSALIIDRLIRGGFVARLAGCAWLIAAALWTGTFLFTHERSLLPTRDVERVTAYLASHDRNDYVLNNLEAAGIIQAYFRRHALGAPDMVDPQDSRRFVLQLFEQTNIDSVHAVIFKNPGSRFIDKTLWPMTVKIRQWAMAAMPMLWRTKTTRFLAAQDARTFAAMKAVGAVKLLEGSEFDLYRIDRATVEARFAADVPPARFLDLGGPSAKPHLLLGWMPAGEDGMMARGRLRCPAQATRPCKTILTNLGIRMPETIERANHADLAIRATGSCALTLRLTFARSVSIRVAVGDHVFEDPGFATEVAFAVPAAALRPGINIVAISENRPGLMSVFPSQRGAPVSTVEIDEPCAR